MLQLCLLRINKDKSKFEYEDGNDEKTTGTSIQLKTEPHGQP